MIDVSFGQIFRVPEVEYISYNVGTRDFPDIYSRALGPAALGLGHIYQANPSCPWYNYYFQGRIQDFSKGGSLRK